MGKRKTLKERFDEKWVLDIETGCWLWIASKRPDGYGQINSGRSERTILYAHRVAYELYREPIPDELELDHLCRARNCVNPEHLESVTGSVNIQRGLTPIRHAQVKSCPKGHEYTDENMYIYSQKSSSGRLVHNRICKECKGNRDKLRYLKQKQLKQQLESTLS
jgi:hypothetical protein